MNVLRFSDSFSDFEEERERERERAQTKNLLVSYNMRDEESSTFAILCIVFFAMTRCIVHIDKKQKTIFVVSLILIFSVLPIFFAFREGNHINFTYQDSISFDQPPNRPLETPSGLNSTTTIINSTTNPAPLLASDDDSIVIEIVNLDDEAAAISRTKTKATTTAAAAAAATAAIDAKNSAATAKAAKIRAKRTAKTTATKNILAATAAAFTTETKNIPNEFTSLFSMNQTEYESYWLDTNTQSTNTSTIRILKSKITNYVRWHNSMRQQFSDKRLLLSPNAPSLWIVYYDETSEGLSGRFSSIHKLLLACIEKQYLLLFKWYHPMDLETFLVPNAFNWTLPQLNSITENPTSLKKLSKRVTIGRRTVKVSNAIKVSKKKYQDIKSIIPYGNFWRLLFTPSPQLMGTLWDTYNNDLHIMPHMQEQKYNVIHLRILHPAHQKLERKNTHDKTGFGTDWYEQKQIQVDAFSTAIHAIQCSNWLIQQQEEEEQQLTPKPTNQSFSPYQSPTYFMSDSQELLKVVLGNEPSFISNNGTVLDDVDIIQMKQQLKDLGQKSKIVGRKNAVVSHLETWNVPVDAYMSTFIDLYVATQARCVTLGVGKFAFLATRISGTKCITMHEERNDALETKWGYSMIKEAIKAECPL